MYNTISIDFVYWNSWLVPAEISKEALYLNNANKKVGCYKLLQGSIPLSFYEHVMHHNMREDVIV